MTLVTERAASTNQLENLSQMKAVLSGNRKADILAYSLWEFFNFQLYCTMRDDDGEPNRHRIEGFKVVDGKIVGDVRVRISIRRNERQEEGLVHELLHANLIPFGYPTFWIPETRADDFQLAEGIINAADHTVMRPIYLSFGYSIDRFLRPTRPLNNRENAVKEWAEQMAAQLLTPDGYFTHLSSKLQRHNINYHAVQLADTIVKHKAQPDAAPDR